MQVVTPRSAPAVTPSSRNLSRSTMFAARKYNQLFLFTKISVFRETISISRLWTSRIIQLSRWCGNKLGCHHRIRWLKLIMCPSTTLEASELSRNRFSNVNVPSCSKCFHGFLSQLNGCWSCAIFPRLNSSLFTLTTKAAETNDFLISQ